MATKLLLLSILFAAFLQNGIEATDPIPLEDLYRKMSFELARQTIMIGRTVRNEGEPSLPVLSKLEMGRHIYAKIDLLEGILAELNAKRDKMEGEREYFLDENAVGMFLEFVKKLEGEDHEAQFFSDFPVEKFGNREFFHFVTDKNWVMDELLGGKYPEKFFEILDRLLEIMKPKKNTEPDISAYHPIRLNFFLFKFIDHLKLEIIVGQTHEDFIYNSRKKIESHISKIQAKIDDGPIGISSKALHPHKVIKSLLQKPREYQKLNKAAMKLHNVLAQRIRDWMNKKLKKSLVISVETLELAIDVKEALSSVGKKTLWESIQNNLYLPTRWLDEQKKLYAGSNSDAKLLSEIQMNTAMLLLGYERTKKLFN